MCDTNRDTYRLDMLIEHLRRGVQEAIGVYICRKCDRIGDMGGPEERA